ncbi:MAG TPA: hypothetical protein VF454_00680, partial [Gemmatimonadales bacterium]
LAPAEVDKLIGERLGAMTGGLDDQVARLVVRNIPRHVARELDHAKLREYKAQALHFHLDLRRPDAHEAEAGNAGPGRRATLPEIVVDYLGRRPLPSDLDRDGFVASGKALIERAERDYAEES